MYLDIWEQKDLIGLEANRSWSPYSERVGSHFRLWVTGGPSITHKCLRGQLCTHHTYSRFTADQPALIEVLRERHYRGNSSTA